MIRNLWSTLNYYLEQKWFILALLGVNFFGSLYGFYWYKNQLQSSPKELLIFVPDSPLSTTYFAIFLILYLFNKKVPFIEALAAVTLFKYGIWATAVIIWGAWATEPSVLKMITFETLTWVDLMLMTSHTLMAFQAIVFFRKYSFGFWSIFLAGLWIFTNDYIDYTRDVHPWLPRSISELDYVVGEFTLYLSGFTLLLFYFLSILRRKYE